MNSASSVVKIRRGVKFLADCRGGILLGIIGTMLVIGVVSAGVVSMIGTSSMHEVHANHAARAFYLAEIGFRYVYADLKSTPSDTYIETVMDDYEGQVLEFSTPDGGTLTIGEFDYTASDDLGPVSVAVDTVIDPDPSSNLNSIVVIGDATGFPVRNGMVSIAGVEDQEGNVAEAKYRYLERAGSVLLDVKAIGDTPIGSVTVVNGQLKLQDHIFFKATGVFGNASRTLAYHWPLSGLSLGPPFFDGDSTFEDNDEDMTNWQLGSGKSMGVFDYDSDEGALVAEWVQAGEHAVAFMAFSPKDDNGNPLLFDSPNYEVQVKMKVDENFIGKNRTDFTDLPLEYALGLNFRMQGSLTLPKINAYGVSLARWDGGAAPPSNYKRMPSSLVPDGYEVSGLPFVALWQAEGLLANNPPVLLAWAPLPSAVFDENSYVFNEWLTLLVRVEQLADNDGDYNRITVMYGDHYDEHARDEILWPPHDLGNGGYPFTVIAWEGPVTHADNAEVTDSLFSFQQPDMEVGLHAFGENLDQKAWFDGFAVRLAGTDRGYPDLVPPIIE